MLLPLMILLACDSEPPPTPAPAPEPAERPTEHQPPPKAAPYTIPMVEGPGGPKDKLVFWGWSDDSSRYAYETWYPGSGAVECDQRIEIIVVDAGTDTYAEGGHSVYKYPSPEGPCGGPSPEEQADKDRQGILKKHRITRSSAEVVLNTGESGEWLVETEAAGWFRLTLARTGDPETFKTGYRLEMHEVGHAGTPKVIEPGTRMRNGVVDYGLHSVFVAPDKHHLAVVVQKTTRDFEALGTQYMTNATTPPPPFEPGD